MDQSMDMDQWDEEMASLKWGNGFFSWGNMFARLQERCGCTSTSILGMGSTLSPSARKCFREEFITRWVDTKIHLLKTVMYFCWKEEPFNNQQILSPGRPRPKTCSSYFQHLGDLHFVHLDCHSSSAHLVKSCHIFSPSVFFLICFILPYIVISYHIWFWTHIPEAYFILSFCMTNNTTCYANCFTRPSDHIVMIW